MVSVAPESNDRTVYPEEERVGEDILQRWIVELLRPLVQRWLEERGEVAFVGADQFIYYRQYDPHARVAPDVYVLPGVPPQTWVRSWKVWESGIAPSFALEVVSTDWEKDYYEVPSKHAALGTQELLIFDPRFTLRRDGRRWQRFTRGSESEMSLKEHTDAPVIRSEVLECYFRVIGIEQSQRLRLCEGRDAVLLFPTADEAERQAKEAERQAKEAERQAKEAALARVAELEALLKLRS